MINPTQRFSSRVQNYVRFRPGYPPQIIGLLSERCGLTKNSIVADVGSGTGKLTELFLRNGNRVFAIEPNEGMREAGDELLYEYSNWSSVNAPAEATGLADASVHFVTVAQAFHWFERERAATEFRRILQPRGWVVLLWNQRRLESTPFLADYEKVLLGYATDYKQVADRQPDVSTLNAIFG